MNPTRSIMSLLARVSPPQMFIIIVGLAAGTTMYVSHEFEARMPKPAPPPIAIAKTKVLVCARNIAEGTMISSDDLEVREVEPSKAPIDSLADSGEAIGRQSKYSMLAGTVLSGHDLALSSSETGFQAKLRPGERAITLAVDTNTGVAGFIMPDSHVDVMVQVGSGSETKTRPILSDVRVVASGTVYRKQPGESVAQPTSNVTFAVTPEEAGKLINGMSAGRIYLTLRSDRDHTPIAVTDVGSLFKKQAPRIADVPAPPPLLPPLTDSAKNDAPQIAATPAPLPSPLHEIEQWQGDKRDVASVQHE